MKSFDKDCFLDKIKVIYILGSRFSGSTLVSLILGAQNRVLNLGEVWALESDYQRNRRCTCGSTVKQCPYWQKIIKRYSERFADYQPGTLNFSDPKKYGDMLFHRPLIFQRLLHHFTNDPDILFRPEKVHQYAKKSYDFYDFALQEHGNHCDTIVDSSKSLERLAILLQSGLFDIRVVFLARNGLSLVGKDVYSSPPWKVLSWIKTAEKTMRWVVLMKRCLRMLAKLDQDRVYSTTYEDFCSDASKVISEMCQKFDVEYLPESLHKASLGFFKYDQHIYTGNSLIDNFSDLEDITYIDAWSKMLSDKDRIMFNLFGGDSCNLMLGING